MGTLFRALNKVQWQPQVQVLRYKSKVNVTKPKLPHFKRHVIEHVCMPIFREKKKAQAHVPAYELCDIKSGRNIIKENPFEDILAREVLNWFKNSKLLAFFHQNPITKQEKLQSQIIIRRNGMKLLSFGRQVMEKALLGTIYQPALIYYQSHSAVIACPEPDLYKLLSFLNKIPKFILLGALAENRFLDHSQVIRYGKIPNIETARVNLVKALSLAPENVVQQLSYPSYSLVNVLQQHENNLKKS